MGVRLEIERVGSPSAELQARYLLDCSGRQTVLGNFFKLKRTYDCLQKFSVLRPFRKCRLRRPESTGPSLRWCVACISLVLDDSADPTRMSIGVVMETPNFRAMKLTAEEALEKCIDEQPMVLERMTNAERVSPVYLVGHSYRNAQLFGDRWLLAGDAAGFIDLVQQRCFFGNHVR